MTTNQKPDIGTRLVSMLLDHFIMSFAAMAFMVPLIISAIPAPDETMYEPSKPILSQGLGFIALIGFAIYFCKDCIQGRSIAKRALKLQVVEQASGKVAPPLKCMVRNLFCIIWPLEVIFTFLNPSRRIGDFVAGTKVVPFNSELEQPKLNIVQVILSLILGYGFMVLIAWLLERL